MVTFWDHLPEHLLSMITSKHFCTYRKKGKTKIKKFQKISKIGKKKHQYFKEKKIILPFYRITHIVRDDNSKFKKIDKFRKTFHKF